MSFLSPIFLLGLPLIGIPIGIHLWNRRQRKILPWGAMRFLTSANTRRRRLMRLTDLLLLILRVLAFLFIVAALSRPLLPVTWLGQDGPRAVVLILDTSLSMALRSENQSQFDRMLEKVDLLLGELGPSDTLQVLVAQETPVWLQESPVEVNAEQRRQIAAQIRDLRPTLGSADFVQALQVALESPWDEEKMVRIINIVSDGQSEGWSPEDDASWQAIRRMIEDQKRPNLVNLTFLDTPGIEATPNLSIDSLETHRTITALGQPVPVSALIQNRGTTGSRSAVLHWYEGDRHLGIASIPALEPGSTSSADFTHVFDTAGVHDLWCELETRDPLELDNQAHLIMTATDQVPVLVVDGSSSTDPLKTDVGYLLACLGYEEPGQTTAPAFQSGFDVQVIPVNQFGGTDLGAFRCIILANPRRLPQADQQRLENFVKNGGGVWLAIGDAISVSDFNDTWFRQGNGLSPLPLVATLGDPEDRESFTRVQPPSETHPATRLLADLQKLDIDKVHVYRRHQFDELVSQDTSVLLRLNGGDAFAIEQQYGRGQSIVSAAPLGLTWSNFPVCQSYVAMVHEWLWHLTRASFPRHNLTLGETPTLDLTDATGSVEVEWRLPDERIVSLSARPNSQTTRLPAIATPGLHEARLPVQRLTQPYFAARDPEESTLAALAPAAQDKLTAIEGIQLSPESLRLPANAGIEIPTTPIAGSLLVALLALVAGELCLAAWCTQQRHPKLTSLSMES